MIKDSGERTEFETGAVRDMHSGKGRCDLLPLGVVADIVAIADVGILQNINQYIRSGDNSFLIMAFNTFAELQYGSIYTALLEVSKHYEDGCTKYGERNWEKGIPLHCYIDSAVRHFLKYLRGDDDEQHDRAFLWNLLGALWTQDNKPDLIDLPFHEKEAVRNKS